MYRLGPELSTISKIFFNKNELRETGRGGRGLEIWLNGSYILDLCQSNAVQISEKSAVYCVKKIGKKTLIFQPVTVFWPLKMTKK